MPTLNYVAAYLRRHDISQVQLAEITGIDNTTLSKISAGTRIPTFDAAIALEVAFGVPVSKLFPDRLYRVQEAVIGRCGQMSIRYEERADAAAQRIMRFLHSIKDRMDVTPAV